MRFSLKKTFTLLDFHRRSKSDSSAMSPASPSPSLDPRVLFLAASLPTLETTGIGTAIDQTLTAFSSKPAQLQLGPPKPPVDHQSEIVKERHLELEADKKDLSDKISALLMVASIHKQNCAQLQNDISNEKDGSAPRDFLHPQDHHCHQRSGGLGLDSINKDSEKASQGDGVRLAQLEKFLSAMIDLGLHIPVLDKAYKAVLNGAMADEALVDAIKEAAARPGTAWSRIVPAIVGPRTPENYISAINLTLKYRRELKQSKKVLMFWKKRAMLHPTNQGLVTPSASALSEVLDELSSERRVAAENFLQIRCRLGMKLSLTKGFKEHIGNGNHTLGMEEKLSLRSLVDDASSSFGAGSLEDEASDVTERPPAQANETFQFAQEPDGVLADDPLAESRAIPELDSGTICDDSIDLDALPPLKMSQPLASKMLNKAEYIDPASLDSPTPSSGKSFRSFSFRNAFSNGRRGQYWQDDSTESSPNYCLPIAQADPAVNLEKCPGVILAHDSESILALSEWQLPEEDLISLASSVNLEYAEVETGNGKDSYETSPIHSDIQFRLASKPLPLTPKRASWASLHRPATDAVERSNASLYRIHAAFADNLSGSDSSQSLASISTEYDGDRDLETTSETHIHWRSFDSGPQEVKTTFHDSDTLMLINERGHDIHIGHYSDSSSLTATTATSATSVTSRSTDTTSTGAPDPTCVKATAAIDASLNHRPAPDSPFPSIYPGSGAIRPSHTAKVHTPAPARGEAHQALRGTQEKSLAQRTSRSMLPVLRSIRRLSKFPAPSLPISRPTASSALKAVSQAELQLLRGSVADGVGNNPIANASKASLVSTNPNSKQQAAVAGHHSTHNKVGSTGLKLSWRGRASGGLRKIIGKEGARSVMNGLSAVTTRIRDDSQQKQQQQHHLTRLTQTSASSSQSAIAKATATHISSPAVRRLASWLINNAGINLRANAGSGPLMLASSTTPMSRTREGTVSFTPPPVSLHPTSTALHLPSPLILTLSGSTSARQSSPGSSTSSSSSSSKLYQAAEGHPVEKGSSLLSNALSPPPRFMHTQNPPARRTMVESGKKAVVKSISRILS